MKTQPRFVTLVGSLLLASSFLAACAPKGNGATGSKPGSTTPGTEVTYNFQQPTISAITGSSAGTPAIGDTMHVFGTNFIDPQHGTLVLSFNGTFTDQTGTETRTPGTGTQISLTYVGGGEATFVLGPDNIFGPSGTVGQFQGAFQVASQLEVPAVNGEIGDMSVSNPQTMTVNIGPSIFLDELLSVDAAASGSPCTGTTPATIGSQDVRFTFHYVGMDDASADDPVFYKVNYDPTQLTVAYVGNQTYGSWPFWGPTSPNTTATVASSVGSFSTSMTSGNGTTFDPQSLQTVVTVNPPVTINEAQVSTVKLAGFATPAVAAGATQPVLFTITATHQSGASITRVVTWSATGPISFGQATPQVLTAWEAAMLDDHIGIVKGSIPNGTNMSYNESSSDTKQKTINMSWNINNSEQIGASLTAGWQAGVTLGLPDVAQVNTGVNFSATANASQTWSQTFGTDVSTSDSITTGEGSNTSVQVNPGEFGAFYIQWGDLTSSVSVTLNDACGNSLEVGTATLTSHVGYLVAETSTQSVPPCPIDASDCHAPGPVTN